MIDAIIVVSTSILNLLLATIIFLRNPRARVNRAFAAFSLSLIIWTIFNYLADIAEDQNLLYTRLTFVAATGIVFSVYWLSAIFPNPKKMKYQYTYPAHIFAGLLIAGLSLTPYLVESVKKSPDGVGVELVVGFGYYVFTAYILFMLASVVANFRQQYKKSNAVEKNQIKLLVAGVVLFSLFAIISNLILPLVVDSWTSSRFGPVSSFIFIAFTGYAIVRHRLLDIRLLLARAVTYALLLVVLGLTLSRSFSISMDETIVLFRSSINACGS